MRTGDWGLGGDDGERRGGQGGVGCAIKVGAEDRPLVRPARDGGEVEKRVRRGRLGGKEGVEGVAGRGER